MKLSSATLLKINEHSTRLKLALALGCTERWIVQCIINNRPDGLLTTATALIVICQETGLTMNEILESSTKQKSNSNA